MTATAAAPAPAPIAPGPQRASPQVATDCFAFAAVLDSLPGAEAKAGSSVAQDRLPTSNEPQQEVSRPGQPEVLPVLYGGTFLSALPFALLPAPASHEGAAAAADASLLAAGSTMGSGLEDNHASDAASPNMANSAATATLVGERAFHFSSVSTSAGAPAVHPPTTGGPGTDAPPSASAGGSNTRESQQIGPSSLAPLAMQGPGLTGESASSAVGAASASVSAGASLIGKRALLAGHSPAGGAVARGLPDAAPSRGEISPQAPIATRVNGTSTNPSAGMPRAKEQSSAQGGRKSGVAASLPVARAESSAAPSATMEPSSKRADPPSDPGPSDAQGGVFGALSPMSLATGPSFGPDDAPARVADIAPRASTLPPTRRPRPRPLRKSTSIFRRAAWKTSP
jgi:hypothetical protein